MEKEKFSVLLCGSKPASSPTGRTLLNRAETILDQHGVIIANQRLLDASFLLFDREALNEYYQALGEAMESANCVLADISMRDPETLIQLSRANNQYHKPAGITLHSNTPTLGMVLTSRTQVYRWSDPRAFDEQIVRFIEQFSSLEDAKVKTKGGRPTQMRGVFTRTGTLVIDHNKQRVLNRRKDLRLSQAEFSFVDLLCERIGHLVQMPEILPKFGGGKDQPMIGSIARNAIKKVNNAEKRPPMKYIENYINSGYLLKKIPPVAIKSPEMFYNGGLHIDRTNNRIWVNDRPISVGRFGLRILYMLADQVGHFLDKREVEKELWGEDVWEHSYIAKTVSRLINAMAEIDPNTRYIESERGQLSMINHEAN